MFSQEDSSRIVEALRKKGAPKPCAVCGHPSFTLVNGLVYLVLQFTAQPMLQGPSLPCAALTCDNCGNTVLINLASIGLANLLGGPSVIADALRTWTPRGK